MNFGSKFKSIRKSNQLNQEEMAEALFTSQGNISQYENNQRIPSIDLLQRLMEKFNIDANWLLSSSNDQIVNFNDQSSCNIASLQTEHFYSSSEQLLLLEKKLDTILSILNKTS